MKYIAIKDAYNIRKGKKVIVSDCKTETSIRNIQIGDLRNNDLIKYCEPNIKYVLAKKDDILIAWDGANAGTIGFHLEGAIGSTLAKLTPKHNGLFYTPFIGYYLQTKFNYFQNTASGATIPHISKKSLESLKLPIISMEKQKKIVNYIQKTKYLINNVNYQIQLLDELEESLFIEMFGDPTKNTKSFTLNKLKDLGELKRGISKHRPRNAKELLGGPYPLIQTGDVANSGMFINEYNSTYSEKGLKQSKMWPANTLCITIAANIAKTGILNFDSCFPDSIVGFKPGDKIINVFLHYWFGFFQKIIEVKAPESAQKNINLKILGSIEVITPSLSLQNEFAKKIEKIEELKKKCQKSLEYYEELYETLLHKAFNDELFKE